MVRMLLKYVGVKGDSEKKELRKKAEEYLNRAEQIKELIKNQDGKTHALPLSFFPNPLPPPSPTVPLHTLI